MRLRGWSVVLLCAASGCSWAFTEFLPNSHTEHQTPRCTESRGFVVSDVAIAGLLGIAAGEELTDEGDDFLEEVEDAAAVMMGVVAVVYGLSALTGVQWTNGCRRAFDAHYEWLVTASQPPNTDPPGTHARRRTPDPRAPAPTTRTGREGQDCLNERSAVPRVNSLHGRASAAAAQGRCRAVLDYATAIRDLDPHYHEHVFMCDASVREACELQSP